MQLVLEVLLPPFVACLVLIGVHTYLGLHVVSRGVIFVDLALAQIAAMGATFAFLLGYDPRGTEGYFYSLLFAFIGAAVFSVLRLRKQRIPQEAIIGITFAVASATSILIADRAPEGAEFVEAMLTGALLWVTWPTIVKTAVVYSFIGLFHWYFRRHFLTISLDPDRAEAEGWNVRWWDFLFYISFGLVITYSVPIAGILLVFSFLVIPSVIAMLYASSIGGRLAVGWSVGTVVSMIGLALSYGYDFPSGPAVVCTFGVALVVAGVLRYLWMAEHTAWAAAKVTATALLLAVGLWLAFSTAAADHAAETQAPSEPLPMQSSPAEQASGALAQLEASPGSPPAEAVDSLLAVGEELHRMMATGEVEITENAVIALARSTQNGKLTELLEEIAYHDDNPWARLRGAEALLTRRNVLGVEPLIDLLGAEVPPFLQLLAADILRNATEQNFEFDPQGDPADKDEAVRQWRDWWEANRSQPFLESTPSSPGG